MNLPKLSEVRPSVIRMARHMEKQLLANDSRGGWSNCDRVYLLEKLEANLRDLKHNLAAGCFEMGQLDCADIANFAMMLSENEYLMRHSESRP